MSLRTLPVTLVLHLKRFEHTGAAQGGKIDAYCQFPLELDVTPYLSSTLTGGQEAFVSLTVVCLFAYFDGL